MIHFAAIRSYSKDGLFHLLQESQVNIGFRDELYRTARDVAELANIRENIEEIDRYVAYLAARGKKKRQMMQKIYGENSLLVNFATGETEKLVELLLEGYDHILDVEDEGASIVDIAADRGREATVQFLQSIPNYVVKRNRRCFRYFLWYYVIKNAREVVLFRRHNERKCTMKSESETRRE